MSTTLYRKYRPQVFEDLVDQDIVKQTLQNEIASGQIAHAYLFSGARGLGKTTTARLLAKAVNCQKRKDKDFEPCNTCDTCQAIINSQSLDLIEIDAASNRGINEIRALKEHIGFTPSGSNYRVFIIDEVHMLTNEAFNALLKTLEEPPPHAVFILATTELHKVPDTIISRCQTFVFRRVNEQHLVERLAKIAKAEGIKVDEKVLGQVAHISGGFIRDAESMLGQLLSLGEKKITQEVANLVLPTSNLDFVVKFLFFLHSTKTSEALAHINELSDQGVDLEYFSKELLEALRQLLISQYSTVEYVDVHLSDLQDKFGVAQLLKLIALVDRALSEIKRADIPQLPLELVVVEYIEDTENKKTKKQKNNQDQAINLWNLMM
jgi:DNA polymerase III subunit gamma/tau